MGLETQPWGAKLRGKHHIVNFNPIGRMEGVRSMRG